MKEKNVNKNENQEINPFELALGISKQNIQDNQKEDKPKYSLLVKDYKKFSLKDLDLLAESVEVPLTFPIFFQDKKVVSVIVRKLYIKDISALKKQLQRFDAGDSRNISTIYRFLEILFTHAIESFVFEDGTVSNSNLNSRLILEISMNNSIKLLLAVFLLNREKPYISANYECKKCNTLNSFDIDPDDKEKINIPEGDYHGIMENLFDFLIEDYDVFSENLTEEYFAFQLERPFKVLYNGNELFIEKLVIKHPTIGSYGQIAMNPRKKEDAELWLIFDNIIGINDLSFEETMDVKKAIGLNGVFSKFLPRDFRKLSEQLFQDGISFKHSFTCMKCGAINDADLDMTNFFGFLLG